MEQDAFGRAGALVVQRELRREHVALQALRARAMQRARLAREYHRVHLVLDLDPAKHAGGRGGTI